MKIKATVFFLQTLALQKFVSFHTDSQRGPTTAISTAVWKAPQQPAHTEEGTEEPELIFTFTPAFHKLLYNTGPACTEAKHPRSDLCKHMCIMCSVPKKTETQWRLKGGLRTYSTSCESCNDVRWWLALFVPSIPNLRFLFFYNYYQLYWPPCPRCEKNHVAPAVPHFNG